jgi:hypothetical protein
MMKGIATHREDVKNLSLNLCSRIGGDSFAQSVTYYILTLIPMNVFAFQGGWVFAVPGMRTHNVE